MSTGKVSAVSPAQTILLVDHNKAGLAARRSILEELGYTVVTALNGVAALAAAESQHFDLVITDSGMPKLDGSGLIRLFREKLRQEPIILMAGVSEAASISSSGADAVVVKTENEVKVLLEAVGQLLNRESVPRFQELVEAKYTRGLTANESLELDRLEVVFRRSDEEFYGPILARVKADKYSTGKKHIASLR